MAVPFTISSVPAQTPWVQYVSGASQTVFPYPFEITQDSDLVCLINGVAQPTDGGYTLSGQGNSNGGNLTFTVGQTVGTIITLYRNIPIARITQLAQNGTFFASNFNNEFNRIYLIMQQLQQSLLPGGNQAYALMVPNSNNPAPTTLLTKANYANSYLSFDSNGNPQPAVLTSSGAVTISILAPLLQLQQTAAEISAAVVPTSLAYPPLTAFRYGMTFNNSSDDTAALNNGISVAAQTVNGTTGAALNLNATGVSLLSSEVTLPNRVRVVGYNERGTYFQAKGTWNSGTSPWMFHAVNGTTSMFDSTLENLTVDANNTAGLGCLLSDAWQDNCGMRSVLLLNFGTSAIKFQNGYGGADICRLQDVEIFGGSIGGATGIDLSTAMGSSAGFNLHTLDTVIAGGGGGNLAYGINCSGNSLTARNLHVESANVGVLIDGNGFISLEEMTGASTVTTLVTIAYSFAGTLVMRNCRRNGATNFIVDQRVAQIQQFGAITAGTLYTAGTYGLTGGTGANPGVALTGGSGTGATALITVSGGGVTQVQIINPGKNYAVGDTLSASSATIGGTGSGFSIPVFQVFTGYGTIAGYDHPYFITKYGNTENAKGLGAASAWCTFDGTATGTNAPAAGYNVAHVTRNSAGNYTVNMTRPMLSTQAAPVAATNQVTYTVATQLSNASNVVVLVDNSGTPADTNEIKLVVFGG